MNRYREGQGQLMRSRRRLLLTLVAAPALAAATVDDGLLHDRVNRKLNNHPALRIRDLKVQVTGGVVTIEGTVRSARVRSRAAKIAAIKGVKKVVNRLSVGY